MHKTVGAAVDLNAKLLLQLASGRLTWIVPSFHVASAGDIPKPWVSVLVLGSLLHQHIPVCVCKPEMDRSVPVSVRMDFASLLREAG